MISTNATILLTTTQTSDCRQIADLWLQESWPISSFDHPDVQLLNPDQASFGIDEVRDLIKLLSFPPYQADRALFMLLAADRATPAAQNALLKSIEEPPATTQIVLVSSQPQGLLPTIISRCVEVNCDSLLELSPQLEKSKPGDETETFNPSDLWRQLLDSNTSVTTRLELASQFTQRDQAVLAVTQLIQWGVAQQPTSHSVAAIKTLSNCLKYLHKNSNVKLTIDLCFLSLSPQINLSFPEINMV